MFIKVFTSKRVLKTALVTTLGSVAFNIDSKSSTVAEQGAYDTIFNSFTKNNVQCENWLILE